MKVGFIGTGVMGKSMAGHILNAGHELRVFNRTKAKAEELISKGAIWCDEPSVLARQSEVIITIVSFPSDVEEIYFAQNGILQSATEGAVVIDMTTSKPSLAKKIYNSAKKRGIFALDAPVSGGDIGAKNAALSIMVGGDKEIFEKMLPIFSLMGKNIVYQGPAGCGQFAKIANQIAIASTVISACEALAFTKVAGLNPMTVLLSIGSGAAGSWVLNNLWPRIIKDDFEPGFYVKHFIKDMKIAIEAAEEMNLELPGLKLAKTLYEKLAEKGGAELGTQALYLLFDDEKLGKIIKKQ